jgi:hypothetical protein
LTVVARRSSSDPVSHYLATGEHVVWRHQPSARALVFNRLPTVIIVVLMTAFLVVIGLNSLGDLFIGPFEPSPWLIFPAGAALFFLVLLYFFLNTLWNHTRHLLDSWDTHYALTDRRLIVVCGRGIIEYDASYFHKMEPLDGEHGKQTLLFDWGPGSKGREYYRERIAGLPDAQKLERLIRDTLRP